MLLLLLLQLSLMLCRKIAAFGDSASPPEGFRGQSPSQLEAVARVFFKSRTMEKRFTATRREGVETPMYAAPANSAIGLHSNNCTHGLTWGTKVRASQAVPQTTPQTGRCRRHP